MPFTSHVTHSGYSGLPPPPPPGLSFNFSITFNTIYCLPQVFDMGQEEHDIILQRVRESKVRVSHRFCATQHTYNAPQYHHAASSTLFLFRYEQITRFPFL